MYKRQLSDHRLRHFLRRRLRCELAPQSLSDVLEARDHRPQLLLLQLVGLALRLLVGGGDRHRPPRRAWRVAPGVVPEERQGVPCAGAGRAARAPRLLQVRGVLRRQRRQRAPFDGRRSPGAARAANAAGGDLLFHLHGDQLRRGRLPRPHRHRPAHRPGGLSLLLPPPDRGADRAGRGAAAPDTAPAGPGRGRLLACDLDDHGRPLQEGRHLVIRCLLYTSRCV